MSNIAAINGWLGAYAARMAEGPSSSDGAEFALRNLGECMDDLKEVDYTLWASISPKVNAQISTIARRAYNVYPY
jgi:hypothetical protein